MTFVASAPGRCGIIGNPSDLYGGAVISASIPHRATCRLTLGGEESLPEDRTLWNAVVDRFPLSEPVKVEWTTDIPRSSGLSGSTALLAATLACVLAARGEAPSLETEKNRTAFAMLVRDIERHGANIVCGFQDALMVVHGGVQAMLFTGMGPDTEDPHPYVRPLDVPLPFLLVMTGVERLSGSVHGPMVERWRREERPVMEAMAVLPQLAKDSVLPLFEGDYLTLGRFMNENHRLVADLGGSGDAIERLVDCCLAHGALGAKLAGAGLGGTVIALTRDPDAMEEALRQDGYSKFLRPAATQGLVLEEIS